MIEIRKLVYSIYLKCLMTTYYSKQGQLMGMLPVQSQGAMHLKGLSFIYYTASLSVLEFLKILN